MFLLLSPWYDMKINHALEVYILEVFNTEPYGQLLELLL